MGLRCVIGHDYGEPETSRDRRQRGNEVVVTEREYRECRRCGHRRILSENKEVTADPSPEAADEADAAASWSGSEPAETADEPASAEAEFSRGASAEPVSAADDDGVILDDEPETPPRAYGEWPTAERGDADAGGDDEPEPWPDEPADAPAEGTAAVGEPAADAPDAAEPDPGTATRPPRRPTDPSDTELVCPECGETWPSINASLRPGDICPECRRGYLDEQVIQ